MTEVTDLARQLAEELAYDPLFMIEHVSFHVVLLHDKPSLYAVASGRLYHAGTRVMRQMVLDAHASGLLRALEDAFLSPAHTHA